MNRRKRFRNAAVAAVLSVGVALSACLTALPARADTTGDNDFSRFVTSYDLTVNGTEIKVDKDYKPTAPIEIQDGTDISLKMEFVLTNLSADGATGDSVANKSFTMKLPAAFANTTTTATQLKANNGTVLGTLTLDKSSGTITVAFNNDADDYDTRGGYFNISAQFSEKGSENGGKDQIAFQFGATSVVVPVQPVVSPNMPTISKKGTYNGDGTITWTVTVSSGNDKYSNGLTGITVTDTYSANQTFQDNPAPTLTLGGTAVDSGWLYTSDDVIHTVTFTLPDMVPNTTATLVYTTKAAEGKPVFPNNTPKYTNQAALNAKQDTTDVTETTQIITASGGSAITWITKAAETATTDSAGRTISVPWTVTVNPSGKGTIAAGATVTDTLPENWSLDTTTVKVGSTVIGTGISTDAPYYKYDTESRTITVTFPQQIDNEQKITFTTNVAPAYYNGNHDAFQNTAKLTQGGNSQDGTAGDVGGSSVVSKTKGNYDPATHRATWKITVNANKIKMTNPIVTDTLDANQAFDGDPPFTASSGATFTKAASKQEMENTAGTYFIDSQTQTMYVHLEDFANCADPVTLTVNTLVTNENFYGSNNRNIIQNKASLTAEGSVSGGSTATMPVPSTVITKSGSYDYATKILTWNITVNQNKMTMSDTVVTDELPSGLTFQAVAVDGTALTANSASTQYYELSGQTLTVHLGNITGQHVITVTEKMDDDTLKANPKNFSVTNTASITSNEIKDVTNTVTVDSPTIQQSIVEKSGSYNKTTNQLDWKVLINKNQIPESQFAAGSGTVTLIDALTNGQVLDPATVKLYPLILVDSVNGTWKADTSSPITLSKSAVKYDPASSTFTFTFPFKAGSGDFSKAYELDFSTDITQTTNNSYTNEVNLIGALDNNGGTSKSFTVSAAEVNAGFSAQQAGKVTVLKQDGATKVPLKGAAFVLSSNGISIRTLETGDSGTVVFDHLRQGVVYTVQETQAPDGYTLNSTPQTFTLTTANLTTLTLAFNNFKTPTGGGGWTPPDDSSSTPGTPDSGAPSSTPSAPGGTSSITGGTPSSPAGTVSTGLAALYLKKADQDGKALSGAEFTLFDASGKVVRGQVTGSGGVVAFKELPAGSYVVRETKAPANYELYDGALNVTLSAGQQAGYTLKDTRKGDDSGVAGWTTDSKLPKTGGTPLAPFAILCGLLLIGAGVIVRRGAGSRGRQTGEPSDRP